MKKETSMIGVEIMEEGSFGYYHITIHPKYWDGKEWRWEPLYYSGIESFEGFYLNSQMGTRGGEETPYATEIKTTDRSLNLSELERMAKRGAKISKRMEKYSEQDGYPQSFGQMALRFAKTIGADTMLSRNKRGELYGESLSEGMTTIDNKVREWYGSRVESVEEA